MLSRSMLTVLGIAADAAWLSAVLVMVGWTISLQAALLPLWAVVALRCAAFATGRFAPTYTVEDGTTIEGRWRAGQAAGGAAAAYAAIAFSPGAAGDGFLWPAAFVSGNATGTHMVAIVICLLTTLVIWRRGIKCGIEGFAQARFQDMFRWGTVSIALAATADAACGCGLLDYRIAALFFGAALSGLALSQLPADDGKATFWLKIVGVTVFVILASGVALGLLGGAYGTSLVGIAGDIWRGAVTLLIDAMAIVLGPVLEWIFSLVQWLRAQLGDSTDTIRPTDLSALRGLGPKSVQEIDGDIRSVVHVLMLALLLLVLYKGFLLGFRGRFRRFGLRSGDEREKVEAEEDALADLAGLLAGLLPEWLRPSRPGGHSWRIPDGPPGVTRAFELYFSMLERATALGWRFDPARTPRERLKSLSETLDGAPVAEITEAFNLACYANVPSDPTHLAALHSALETRPASG